MEQVFFPPLSRVVVFGGAHGNELAGVQVVKEMQKHKMDKLGSVSVTAVLANPPAVDACRRYMDTDLNRCFSDASLSVPLTDSSYELRRAHELNAQFGPKGSKEAVDLICDLHNTTANMGVTLMVPSIDWITLHISKYLQSNISTPVRIIGGDFCLSECYSLDSVGKHGLSLEVGPQPHGVVRADIYTMMKKAVDLILEWLDKFNAGRTFEGGEVEVFIFKRTIDYPRDPTTGEMTAVIHPQLQDNDFKLLQPGDPVFMTFSQETVKYEGEALYPFFVNECAYYEMKGAFRLAEKKTLSIPTISVSKRD